MATLVKADSPDVAISGAFETFRRRPVTLLLTAATMASMTLGALIMLVVALVTLFQARRFYTEVMARSLAQVILWLWGVRVEVHQAEPFPRTQTIYISNHTSTLDPFVVVALGLPKTRFFLYGPRRKIVPLGVIAHLMGTFFTSPQTDRAGRVRCFRRAERVLRRTGDCVYLSPEGERVTTGAIGHFNKGAFHLATSLGVPIVPFYIDIPREMDPGIGLDVRPGTVRVHVMPAISTHHWKLKDLEGNKERVRDLFVTFQRELRASRARVEVR